MPDQIALPLQLPTPPEGFCNSLTGPDWVQVLFNLIGQGRAILSSASGAGTIILNQESVPGIDQRNFLWRRPSRGNLIFSWQGAWVAAHLYPPNDPVASMWVEATPNQIWLFDGGDGSDPAITSPNGTVGAMWVIDPNYAGRSPMGVGAIPGNTPPKTLGLGENYGEGTHTGVLAEVPPHTHTPDPTKADDFLCHAIAGAPATLNIGGGGDTIRTPQTGVAGGTGTPPAAQPFNVVHPSRGGYRIIRSNRQFYIAT